jgi:group I intron endonuclease
MIAVYRITCLVNGKSYIGGTTDIARRWKEHRSGLRGGGHSNHRLQAAWNEFGEGAFEFVVLQECSVDELRCLEDRLLAEHDAHTNGFNLSHLGAGLTTEGRALLSERMKGNTHHTAMVAESRTEAGRRRRLETMKRLNATGTMRFKKRKA